MFSGHSPLGPAPLRWSERWGRKQAPGYTHSPCRPLDGLHNGSRMPGYLDLSNLIVENPSFLWGNQLSPNPPSGTARADLFSYSLVLIFFFPQILNLTPTPFLNVATLVSLPPSSHQWDIYLWAFSPRSHFHSKSKL